MTRIIRTYYLFWIIIGLLLNSCIEEYIPNLSNKDINKIVINGGINNNSETQTIYISNSSDVSKPSYNPVSNCDVKVYDIHDNIFQFYESTNGQYNCNINANFLTVGNAFRIEILMPNGDLIISDFDTLYNCPDIDTAYYALEEILTPDPDNIIQGIQFYIDYNGLNTSTKHIKWDIYETWEYHARYPRRWYIDFTWIHEIVPPDYSKNVCWSTEKVIDIFTLSTENLTENKYIKFPLHYVDNTTQKLAYGYSILIKQSALSIEAFNYYKNLKSNIADNGGLYDKQPFYIQGNLTNTTNTDQQVLGFFYASTVKTKRIFINPIEDLELNYDYYCNIRDLSKVGLRAIRYSDYPADLWLDGVLYWIQENCYDCTCAGGTLNKPVFWP